MKLRTKIILLAAIPVLCVGLIAYLVASDKIETGITEEAYSGMQATTLAVEQIFELGFDGAYSVDENGDLWKGDSLNISDSNNLVDSIKEKTGFDVTIFFGDTRYLTTVVDESGNRQVGTVASTEVTEEVLKNGNDFYSNDVDVVGERYICYYIPLKQDQTDEVVGMIFLGEKYSQVSSVILRATAELLGLVILNLVIAVIVAAILASRIVNAINTGISYVGMIGEGNLGIHVDNKLLTRKDAIGDMCRHIQDLDERLISIIGQIRSQCDVLEDTSVKCAGTANSVLDSVGMIDTTIQEIATTTTSQAQDAVTAGDNVTVMGEMIEDTTKEVDSLADATDEMAVASDSAKETLKELNESMHQVIEAVDSIYVQTNNTHESVQQIGEMTMVISEIASQTNLLSLNASIEAARAGEQGKGFAVVAMEIQKLAEQSDESADKIQQILTKLTDNSQQSVSAMGQVKNIVKVQEDKIAKTNTVFATVEDGIDKSIVGIKEIDEKTRTLDEARTNTVAVVQNVAAIAQENAASTEETAASVDEINMMVSEMAKKASALKEIADILEEEIKIFKLQ